MEELVEGEVLADRYLLGPVVGHGAMGQVHLAEDLRLKRPVAIKSLRPELARYADVRQRFGHEARAAARISHPNVVRVYDSGERGAIPYLVMECLPGTTLVDELAWGPLEPRRARAVGLDVLGALDAAHRMGIVHRDVKPGNILLSAALDGPVKVSDFGIAKSAADHSLTDSGALVGTAAYLAPERVAGGPAGPATDLFSLGVVLYEAVAGRKPYEGDTSLAIALAIHMGEAPGLLDLRPDLDPLLADVVEKAIARDPADRWGSAAEMAEALGAWRPRAGGPPLVAANAVAAAPVSTVPLPAPVDAPTVRLATEPPDAGGDPEHAGRGDQATLAAASSPAVAEGADRPPTSRRRPAVAAAAAGVGLLVVLLLVGLTARGNGDESETAPPTTAAEVVAATAPTTTAPAVEETVAPARSGGLVTTRPPRRPSAPATTAPATTRPVAATTTTRPAVTTTRPPATTTPTTSAPSTSPTTAPPALTAEPAVPGSGTG